jgi:hypothetical protein
MMMMLHMLPLIDHIPILLHAMYDKYTTGTCSMTKKGGVGVKERVGYVSPCPGIPSEGSS